MAHAKQECRGRGLHPARVPNSCRFLHDVLIVNVEFFHGAALPDPSRLLQGTGSSWAIEADTENGHKRRSATQAHRCGLPGYKGARGKQLARRNARGGRQGCEWPDLHGTDVHAFDQAILEGIHMLHHLVFEDLSR